MEKMLKKIKIVIVMLLVIIISLIAFWGIFTKENGVWSNLIPDYKLGLDIKGARELRHVPDDSEEEKYVYVDENGNVMGEVWEDGSAITEEEASSVEVTDENASEESTSEENAEDDMASSYKKETRTIKANEDDSLTKENFEQTKKVIQERLEAQGISEYAIRLDDVTGSLVIESKDDNDEVDKIEDLVSNKGKFEVIDYQNGLVLMDNSDIKTTTVVTSANSGYDTYLQIEFNKEGSQKLKDLSNKYVEVKEENTENSTENDATSEETSTKTYISIVFDDTTMMTTYFGEEMSGGMIQIPVGDNTTDYEEYLETYNSAKLISDILNSGLMPINYSLEVDNFVQSDISNDSNIYLIIAIVIVIILSIIFIVKFKLKGVLASVLCIGYIASISIAIRYTNAEVTLGSIFTYCLLVLLNYIMMKRYLKNQNKDYIENLKEVFLRLIPLCVIGIVFTLSSYYLVNSIGMAIFWGLILNVLYNLIFTRTVFKNLEKRDV